MIPRCFRSTLAFSLITLAACTGGGNEAGNTELNVVVPNG